MSETDRAREAAKDIRAHISCGGVAEVLIRRIIRAAIDAETADLKATAQDLEMRNNDLELRVQAVERERDELKRDTVWAKTCGGMSLVDFFTTLKEVRTRAESAESEARRLRERCEALDNKLREYAIHWYQDGQIFRCGICWGVAADPRRRATVQHNPDCTLAAAALSAPPVKEKP